MVPIPTTLEIASMNPTCDSCRWFYVRNQAKIRDRDALHGECRIEPPASNGKKWPYVWGHDFCGRHADLIQYEDPQFPKGV